jgi:integrase
MTEVEPYAPVPAAAGGQLTAEQLVVRWLTTKRSAHTRFNYGLDLGVRILRPGAETIGEPRPAKAPDWLTFCGSAGIHPLGGVRQEHVALWARGMEAAGLSAPTVARKLAAVSSWYAWLKRQGYVAENPADGLPRPEVDPDTSKTPGLTREQALAILAAADGGRGASPRNAALAALLLFTGARVSEVCGAVTADISMDRGHRVLWVTRKGGVRQALVMPPPVITRLDAYLATRPDTSLPAVRGHASAPRRVFVTSTGKPMRPADVWGLMRRLGRAAGLPAELVSRMGAHSMRHSFATLYLDAGGNLVDLQDAMGHKDPRTTRRYDRSRSRLDRSPGYTLANYLAGTE